MVAAVSYTHLDVYKRQIHDHLLFFGQTKMHGSILFLTNRAARAFGQRQRLVSFGNRLQLGPNLRSRSTGFAAGHVHMQAKLFDGGDAVSYTHLDVYKRQVAKRLTPMKVASGASGRSASEA